MEPEDSLSWSQQPATCPNSKAMEVSVRNSSLQY